MSDLGTEIVPVLNTDERGRIWWRRNRRLYDGSPRRLPEFNVLICSKGRARYFINGQIVQFRARAVLFAQPGDSHFLVSETQDADFVVALFDPGLLRPPPVHPAPNARASSDTRELHMLDEATFRRIMDLSSYLTDETSAAALELGLSWWLHVVWEGCREAERITQTAAHPAVATALVLLRNDPTLAIGDVAHAATVSPDHLSTLFRQTVGCSMVQYRTKLRLELVERLVQNTPSLKLETAAFQAGFKDYSSFYRSFRKSRGAAPRSSLAQQAGDPPPSDQSST